MDALKTELAGLRMSRNRVFQAPLMEWIEERLATLEGCPGTRDGAVGTIIEGSSRPYSTRTNSRRHWTPLLSGPHHNQHTGHNGNAAQRRRRTGIMVRILLRWWRRRESNPCSP